MTRHRQESAAPSAAVEEQVEPNEVPTWPDAVLEALDTHGLGAMSEAFRLIVNEAMRLERERFIGAAAHQRVPTRRAQANGFKLKTLATRLGRVTLAVPQVRQPVDGERFYPKALERGERSERALIEFSDEWETGRIYLPRETS